MNATPHGSAVRNWIAQSLSDARLGFDWEPGHAAVARLALRLPHRPELKLSVRHDGTVLQVVAHAALAGADTPQVLADRDVLNQSWGIARAYFAPRSASWDLSGGLYAPERAAPGHALLALLGTMADAPDLITRESAPLLIVEPALAPAAVMPGVFEALAAAGMQARSTHGGEVASMVLQMDRLRVRVDCFLSSGAMLMARGHPVGVVPVPATPAVLRALNALNGRLDIGGLGLAYDHGVGMGWVAHPAAWFQLEAKSLRWTCERAASWAEAAHLTALAAAT